MAYYVNPEGQRLRKSGAAGTSYFAPDRNGPMLAEYSGGGWIDYVWLNGRLIGRVAGGQRYAIHDDQTGRPEAVTDGSGAVVWRAQNFAFTQNVTNAGIALNLGFPGQYYDAETSAWNNGFRDYKSALGRYVESDPIGLSGGVNTYAYVRNNPLRWVDPLGLMVIFKGSSSTVAALQVAYANVGTTQLGQQLERQLESSSTVYTITNLQDGNAFFDPATDSISVDPNFHPLTQVDTGTTCATQSAPTDAMLGHEIGHAATGVLDDGPGNMNNVNQNENPMRQQLGEPIRASY